ncbi:MAG: RIP metalloprotease RseP [Candidatus Methylumidiphilus alinenensis]|uniref:Zinc metalloprotease n=1 Tax=Candidatus Methylumidiphilus alinenensis TaxID=2202197 RepID=A0A2W4QZJ5_9GAMM|nr:MAG: RIP metalloprotease RseP [Candidatus Methylumidiphilus alinenensis]
MQSFSLIHTVFYFLLALVVLVAFHEFGHFYACRKLGVKVKRFSIGIGKPVWSYRKTPDDTEFAIGLLPLGGYVKMVDEREGEVSTYDLPYAFNRQRLAVRAAIVFAGPLANFLLAVLLYWIVFMVGETGLRPVMGSIANGTLAEQAGFLEGDEILAVGDTQTPTWGLAMGEVIEQAMDNGSVTVEVKTNRDAIVKRVLTIPSDVVEKPEMLHDRLGLQPMEPSIPPIVDKIEPKSAAEAAGLTTGDRLLVADGKTVKDWRQWVEYVRANPEKEIDVKVLRAGGEFSLSIRPVKVGSAQGAVGKIGASVLVPEELINAMQVKYRLGVIPALFAAVEKTWDYSTMTLKMIGRMIIGKASVDNLSGPISIAQYAGQSASMGLVQFLKFIAIVSVSLGVLNLLPIPVLDGGHLMFYGLEAAMGKPIPESLQIMFQNIGIVILFSLMFFSFYLDIFRHQ